MNNNNAARTKVVKVLFLGDNYIGKTSLVNIYYGRIFEEFIFPADFFVKKFDFEDKTYRFNIFELPGGVRHRYALISNLRNVKIIVLVFDMTKKKSFLELDNILKIIQENIGFKVTFLFIGTKADLFDQWEIREKDIKKFAEIFQTKYFISSAKNEPEKLRIFLDSFFKDYIKTHKDELQVNNEQRINLPHRNNHNRGRHSCF